jgi:hypothetical protein
MVGTRIKLAIITAIDWIDAAILNHRFHPQGLCDWIVDHPWWGEDDG